MRQIVWLLPPLLGAFSGIWVGCVSSQEEEITAKLSPEQQATLDQYKAEIGVGRNMAGRLLQYYQPLDNPVLLRYVNTVGQLVVQNSPFQERRFSFGILNTDQINAFAVPGGYVLVTRGAIEKAKSEAELAAILGHEIAHVGKKHVYNALLKRMDTESEEKQESREDLPAAVRARERPQAEKSDAASVLAKYMSGATAGQFNILNAMNKGLSVLLEDGLDPSLEFEADAEGLQYALAAGYEPRAMESYFSRILKNKETTQLKVLNKTHPSVDDRLTRIRTLISTQVPEDYSGALGEKRYAQVLSEVLGK